MSTSFVPFSAALRCGLIEAALAPYLTDLPTKFSAALRCGLIEARAGSQDMKVHI